MPSVALIPSLTEHGLLPAGEHVCGLDDIAAAFASDTMHSQRRLLLAKLRQFAQHMKDSGHFRCLYVNGSFATAKEIPGDIDVICVFKSDHDFSREYDSHIEYSALQTKALKRRYGFDVLHTPHGSDALTRQLAYFALVRDRDDVTKGILRVDL